ncbi:MAG: hypothetical protein KDJ39_05930 [Gammaproteobacteria bacterium]|nr:hypothetical protein [Gammaproteobacteria bacterium]
MSNIAFNIAKGRAVELHSRVVNNDPANAAIVVVLLNVTGDQDAALKDADTLAAVLALANVAEITNSGYARKVLTDADLSDFTTDDTNDRNVIDTGDLTFSGIAAGDAITDVLFCYDSDTTGGTDANIVPLTLHDFAATPDGNDIVIQVSDYLRSA